jgi:hypothetical protein
MKTLRKFINEALFDLIDYGRIVKARTVKPKDRAELKQIIEDTIEKKGNKCDLNFIDTSEITDMSWLFDGSTFNGDISNWDVSGVKDMNAMFRGSNFNGDISKWDVSGVKDMNAMFRYSSFNGDISDWDVSKVKTMIDMFAGSSFNGDISMWDMSSVIHTNNMFGNNPLRKIYGTTPKISHGQLVNV